MSTFALDASSSTADIVGGLNYALANLDTINTADAGNVLVANITTGQITTTSSNSSGYTSTTVVSYLYRYMDVKYANSSTGGSGFTSNCTLANYYGLRNTQSTVISNNPADYAWYQVTGGFGTTKSLWYQTIGGRQIAFFAGNAAPQADFIAVPDNTPLDLDTVTSAQNNQIVNVNAYFQSNTVPATPSGGTYNFVTFTLTPPNGWSATIPTFVANTSVYVSQATFVGNSISTVGPATLWTTPAVYSAQFQGNTGAQGERGFVPLGFVVAPSNPTLTSDATLTSWFSASRSNASPPIGLGFAPIANDTAQFLYTDNFNPNNDVTVVKQYNGSTWTTVPGEVVSGGLIVPGTITANTLNANQVYALTVTGGNVTPGVNSGFGYWLTANIGNAYFGGDITIGNNLKVGSNAQFGGNLNVTGLITQGNLGNAVVTTNSIANGAIIGNKIAANTITGNLIQANTIQGNSIVAGSITATQLAADALSVNTVVSSGATLNSYSSTGFWLNGNTGNARFGSTLSIGDNLTVGNNAVIGNNLSVGGNFSVSGLITAGLLAANVVATNNLLQNATTTINVSQDTTGVKLVNFSSTSASSGGWPNSTRGVAQGITVTPSTTGSISGSKLVVNYSAYISSTANVEYNLVELWRSGSGVNYSVIMDEVFNLWPKANGINAGSSVNSIGAVGSGNTVVSGVGPVFTQNASYTFSSNVTYTAGAGYYSGSSSTQTPTVIPLNSTAIGQSFIPYGCMYQGAGTGTSVTGWPYGPNRGLNTTNTRTLTIVGSGGSIYHCADNNLTGGALESSGVYFDLYSVASSYAPDYNPGLFPNVDAIAVGQGGTILYNSTRNYSSSGVLNSVGTWTNYTTINASVTGGNNLNCVFYNWMKTTTPRIWVAVGDSGMILTTGSPTSPWTRRTSNTTQNLRGIAYDTSNNRWLVCGDGGTLLTSTDGVVWTSLSSGTTLNLNSISYDYVQNWYNLATSGKVINGGNTLQLNVGSTYSTTNIQRLQFQGSWPYIGNVDLPPLQQRITNSTMISGQYVDYNYSANTPVTYYVVVGNMAGAPTYTANPTILVTEQKR